MPINIKNAPIKSFFQVKDNIQSFQSKEVALDNNGDHHHHVPHKIYDASIFDLAEGKKLANVKQTGWRYLFEDAHDEYHIAEIGINEELDEHQFHHVNKGNQVNSFVTIYDRLHNHEHVEEKGYEINVLRISPIYVKTIWLKGEDHDHEFFIPLAPVHEKFEAGRTYDYDEFMALLQEVAQEVVGVQEEQAADDLTRIEGIGPKAAEILKKKGILSFADLANSTAESIKNMLVAESTSYNRFDTTTWPEQAQLAADGKWEELDKLQDELQGGKRV